MGNPVLSLSTVLKIVLECAWHPDTALNLDLLLLVPQASPYFPEHGLPHQENYNSSAGKGLLIHKGSGFC